MATRETIERWLDLLIKQTDYGNLRWTQERRKNFYSCVTTEAAVYFQTRDNDAAFPYVLSVADSDGNVEEQWTIYGYGAEDVSDAAPEWLAARARALWDQLDRTFSTDPVTKMLAELESLPPF